MVLLESSLGRPFDKFPHFQLMDTNGVHITSEDAMGENGLIVIFTCNHCPYAKALWNRLIIDQPIISAAGFSCLAINPNINPKYPEDSYDNMKTLAKNYQLPFSYLVDHHQDVARQFGATCTPDFFVLNPAMQLIYRGAYDDNWKDSDQVTEKYLINALNKSLTHGYIQAKHPSIGCSIKWQENQ